MYYWAGVGFVTGVIVIVKVPGLRVPVELNSPLTVKVLVL